MTGTEADGERKPESAREPESERIRRIYRTYMAGVRGRWSLDNPGNQAIRQEQWLTLELLLKQHRVYPSAATRILEVGCGSGNVLSGFLEWGVPADHLYGVDLLPERLELGREKFPGIHFSCANAEQLEFADQSFDLVLVFTVFSSILEEAMARGVAAEIRRVLRPGGAVVWYDFRYNNPYDRHVRGMTHRRIASLFAGCTIDLRRITLLPPLARRLGRLTPVLYPLLSLAPFLRTHYMGVLTECTAGGRMAHPPAAGER